MDAAVETREYNRQLSKEDEEKSLELAKGARNGSNQN